MITNPNINPKVWKFTCHSFGMQIPNYIYLGNIYKIYLQITVQSVIPLEEYCTKHPGTWMSLELLVEGEGLEFFKSPQSCAPSYYRSKCFQWIQIPTWTYMLTLRLMWYKSGKPLQCFHIEGAAQLCLFLFLFLSFYFGCVIIQHGTFL